MIPPPLTIEQHTVDVDYRHAPSRASYSLCQAAPHRPRATKRETHARAL